MNEIIINGIFTLCGAMIGTLGTGFFMYMQNKTDKESEMLRKDLVRTANQVKSYWNLENLYCEALSKAIDKKTQPLKIEFRDKVEELNYDRPDMTERDADKIISKY